MVHDDERWPFCATHPGPLTAICPVTLDAVRTALGAMIPFLSIPEGMAYTVNPDTLIGNDISFRQAARMCADALARLEAAG